MPKLEVEDPEVNIIDLRRIWYAVELATQYYQRLITSHIGDEATKYLQSRGVSASSIATFRLGYAPKGGRSLRAYLLKKGFTNLELSLAGLIINKHDRFCHKLMIPIANFSGRIAGFGARVFDNSEPKYINSPLTTIFHKSHLLYGLYQAINAIKACREAVIVEGYMDVITAHQHGFKNVVGIMGTALTKGQIDLLRSFTKKIVVAFDGDEGGQAALLEFTRKYVRGDFD